MLPSRGFARTRARTALCWRPRGDHFYQCLNGIKVGSATRPVFSLRPGDSSEDPRLDHVTHDIVLWSGLSLAEQSSFKVLKLPGDGSRVPLLLGTTIGSKVVAAMNTFDWDNEADCAAKTSASANTCVQGCGWDKSSTLKPWEAMSRWLAEFGAKGNDRA